MIRRGTEEPIDFPRPEWTDETGKVWSRPTLEFMQLRGFVVVVDEVVPTSLADLKTTARAEVATWRRTVINYYSGMFAIYGPNYDAAKAIDNSTGDSFLMPNGQTANAYAATSAAEMGMTNLQWSAYILGEWQTLGTAVKSFEDCYLKCLYNPTTGIAVMETAEEVALMMTEFRSMVRSLLPANMTLGLPE